MVMMQIVSDDRGVQQLLNSLDTALNPIALAGFLMAEVSPFLAKRASDRFQQEGGSEVGGQWKPLAEATQEIRISEGYGGAHPINQRTRELRNYIESGGDADPTVYGAVLNYPGRTATGELASKVRVAQVGGQQEGMRPTPPRPVLGMDATDLMAVLTMLSQYVSRPAGLRSV